MDPDIDIFSIDPDRNNFFYGTGYRQFFYGSGNRQFFLWIRIKTIFFMDPDLNKISNILKVLNKQTKNNTTCNNKTKLEIYTVATWKIAKKKKTLWNWIVSSWHFVNKLWLIENIYLHNLKCNRKKIMYIVGRFHQTEKKKNMQT